MFEIRVESEFSAAHALVIGGVREPLHGHNWKVEAIIAGPSLDADGLLCDFHTVESALREITSAFHNRNLHDVPPFDRVNPTAEAVARHIAEELSGRLDGPLAPHARVDRVSVSEAPRCTAVYVSERNP